MEKRHDLIDRQDAIDAARDWYEGLICGSFRGLEKRLRAVPSAQPYTEEEIQRMQDMEQAQLDKAFELGREDSKAEIVRCKDCKWCVERYDTDGNAPYWICKNWDGGTDADGFCYEAERRTDGSN